MKVAGVDGCRGGWIVVYGNDKNDLHGEMIKNIQDLLAFQKEKDIRIVAIDIPIGLPSLEKKERNVDKEAKKILKDRASSVFMAPVSDLVLQKVHYDYKSKRDFKDVCDASEIMLGGRRISMQVFCLFNKLRDVNDHIEEIRKRGIKEFHPELCWPKQITNSKKTKQGYSERICELDKLLEYNDNGTQLYEFIQGIRKNRCNMIARDDVVDALCGFVMAKKITTNDFEVIKESQRSPSSEIYYFPKIK